MKKLLIALVVLALLVWVVSWFRTPEAVATSAARPWPGELGPLDEAIQRNPPRPANEAHAKLASLAKKVTASEAVDEFVAREISRGELAIGEPPALPDTEALRDLLLHETIVWERREGIGGGDDDSATRTMQLTVARALVASALAKARLSDSSAWHDLHAVWKLARSLDGQPQMMTQTAALAMARMINGAAWKLPLPVPAWFGDVQQHDRVAPLLEAFHYSAASYSSDGATLFPTKMLADSIEHDRRIAEELSRATHCDVTVAMNDLGTDLRSVWRRAFRYRAEREATANALRLRQGKAIEPASRCSDGAWTFDGTSLKFSREIATAPPDRPMPLVLRLANQAEAH